MVPRRTWANLCFLDAFLGGGSVSLYAKASGFRVIATDIAERAITVGEALIANSRVRLTREDVMLLVAPSLRSPGRVERDYVPAVFTRDQARFIDAALIRADLTGDRAKAALYRLLAIRVALLAHPYSQVRKGTIHRIGTGEFESITESALYHYVDGLRLTHPGKLWELAQQVNAGVFAGTAEVRKASVLDVLPDITADVAYFDPPYPGVMSYEKEYKTIDEILEGQSRPTSPFTAKDGAALLDTLFERAQHIPVWLLSLGNEVVGLDDLEQKMARLGRATRAIEIRYQHLAAVATEEKKARNREFLVVGWDPEAALLREGSVNRLDPERLVAERHVADIPVEVHADPDRGASELSAAEPFARDGKKQRKPTLAKQAVARRRRPSKPERRVDQPHPVGRQLRRGGDRERR